MLGNLIIRKKLFIK